MLQGLDGVERARVDTREDRAVVVYDAGRVTTDELVTAVREAGFEASLSGAPTEVRRRPGAG